jgi:hypothetical protein
MKFSAVLVHLLRPGTTAYRDTWRARGVTTTIGFNDLGHLTVRTGGTHRDLVVCRADVEGPYDWCLTGEASPDPWDA